MPCHVMHRCLYLNCLSAVTIQNCLKNTSSNRYEFKFKKRIDKSRSCVYIIRISTADFVNAHSNTIKGFFSSTCFCYFSFFFFFYYWKHWLLVHLAHAKADKQKLIVHALCKQEKLMPCHSQINSIISNKL